MSAKVILVADPDPLQRQLIDMLVADVGAELVGLGTARQVLEYLRENTPALIVLAMELPDLDGAQTCARIRSVQRLASVPVILTTVQVDGIGVGMRLREQARSAGVDLVLPKPLGDKNLSERARRLIGAGESAGVRGTGGAAGGGSAGRANSTLALEEALRDLDNQAGGTGSRPGGHPGGQGAASGGAGGNTGGAKPDGFAGSAARSPGTASGRQEPRNDFQELEELKLENARLRREAVHMRAHVEKLKAELEELKRGGGRGRGLFGRRKD